MASVDSRFRLLVNIFVLLQPLRHEALAEEARCTGGYITIPTGMEEGGEVSTCRSFQVDPQQSKEDGACVGYDEATPRRELNVQAVLYVPRPVGVEPPEDVYHVRFSRLHRRDLTYIKEVIGANTVRLEPWDVKVDHSDFFDICNELGLWVIPSFDIRYWVANPDAFLHKQMSSYSAYTLTSEVISAFESFLSMSMKSADDPVLMWSLNYALPLNTTAANGEKSSIDKNPERDLYFQLLCAIRHKHLILEWNPSRKQFDRPLALPIDLGSKTRPSSSDEVSWYVALTETHWGRWPDCPYWSDSPTEPQKVEKEDRDHLYRLGSFDVWIVESMAVTSKSGVDHLKNDLLMFNITGEDTDQSDYDEASGSGVVWHDPMTRTQDEPDGKIMYGCDEDEGCNYRTRKAVVAQFGFAALGANSTTLKLREAPDLQQKYLKEVWDALQASKSGYCAKHVIIDEYMDNWQRTWSWGCISDAYIHSKGGMCDETSPGLLIHHEWFGLASQYSFFGFSCIEFRGSVVQESEPFCFDQKDGKTCEERFEDTSMPGKCSWFLQGREMRRGWRLIAWLTLVAVTFLSTILRIRSFVWGAGMKMRSQNLEGEDTPKEEAERGGWEPATSAKEVFQIPDVLQSGSTAPSEFMPYFTVDMVFRTSRSAKKNQFTKDHASLFLRTHAATQERRLWRQIEAEAFAVQAQDSTDKLLTLPEVVADAVANVHLRVTEAYIAWLRFSNPDSPELKDLLEPEKRRHAWELYTEALLLRLLESLSEQALHSPELIAAIFHKVRVHRFQPGTTPHFTIDYELLQTGIHMLHQQPNPYIGGLNFDDLNDCGVFKNVDKFDIANPEQTFKKTFQEAANLMVVIDIVENFQTVFTLKGWMFMVAWYCYLVVNDDNDRMHGMVTDMTGVSPVPTSRCANSLQFCVALDSLCLFLIEVSVFVHGYKQGRIRWRGYKRWIGRRFVNILTGLAGLAISFLAWQSVGGGWLAPPKAATRDTLVDQKWTKAQEDGLMFLSVYLVIRGVLFLLVTRPWFLNSKGDIYPRGWALTPNPEIIAPSRQRTSVNPGSTTASSQVTSNGSTDGLADEPAAPDANARKFRASMLWPHRATMVWLIMLSVVFFFEVFYVAPLVSEFTFEDFCYDSCGLAGWDQRGKFLIFPKGLFKSNCAACAGSMFFIWVLVLLTAFFDIYFFFYLGTAVIGYMMGESRGLRGVLSTALRHIDLSDESSNSTRGRVEHGLTDGAAMRRVFGRHWRRLWSRIVEALYDECLVSDDDANKMVKCAGVARWDTEKQRDLSQSPPKQPPDTSLDTAMLLPPVRERISFFLSSLRMLLQDRVHKIRPERDTLLDSHIGCLPSCSQVIPCYDETVILEESYLCTSDGVNTNLGFMVSQYPEEWSFFAKKQKIDPDQLYNVFVSGELRDWARCDAARAEEAKDLIMEVRMWASMRSQTVGRTIVGAMQYHEVVSLLPSVSDAQKQRDADDPQSTLSCSSGQSCPSQGSRQSYRMPKCTVIENVTQLMLAHQTYGSKAGKIPNDQAVRYMLKTYKDKPFFLVFDFDKDRSRDHTVHVVRKFLYDNYFKEGHDMDATKKFVESIQYASVMARYRQSYVPGKMKEEDAIEIIEVLPRYYPLLLGAGGFRTQGKAGNQLGALRFASGHYLQMMDANMGASLGEAAKVPFVLRRFQPYNRAGKSDRQRVETRILGFREFIFTEYHGTVGSIMASAEWSFGTICQRFLAGVRMRMHYGHPDFLDGFWASNRGSLSKASPAINLSEDIFAGFNVRMRGERSKHVDTLAWDKGRESSFNSASLFFTKVSSGSVGVMRSRDLKIITEDLNIADSFSFYFASIGFYLNNLIIDKSVCVYIILFSLMTLASKSLNDIGKMDSMLAAEWVFSLGIVAMLPRLLELTLEYGAMEAVIRFIPSIPGSMAAFTFINKSIAASVNDTIVTGEGSYIATGRPNANTHYSWKECYFIFVSTHYYAALDVIQFYVFYRLLASNYGNSSLPMFVVLITVAMWLIAPILFCPQPTVDTMGQDLSEFWQFCIATPELSLRQKWLRNETEQKRSAEDTLRTTFKDSRSTLYDMWLHTELKRKRESIAYRIWQLFCKLVYLAMTVCMLQSAMLENLWTVFVLYLVHFCLMELWRVTNRSTGITLITLIMWVAVPLCSVEETGSIINYAVTLYVVFQLLEIAKSFITLIYWLFLQCRGGINLEWKNMPEKTTWEKTEKVNAARRVRLYDILTEYMYVSFLGYQRHLYASIFILLLNLATQAVLVLLDMTYGLHSYALLNSAPCCRRHAALPRMRSAAQQQVVR
eukprot:TRINITY_DN16173_c0_g2_i8.p1 TRINITY_DN16173_c0_g2~~TRINITY_DN16173_c0_g2_i8.p1  ORF type:complete len:2302 (+),score=424.77 TRINITY_DN16173_c0_g2_i8:85-6990(+)